MPSNVAKEMYQRLTNGYGQAFENTSTSVAASQMRNALNNLSDSVQDPQEKKVSICPSTPNSFGLLTTAL